MTGVAPPARPALRLAAWTLGGLTLALIIFSVVLTVLTGNLSESTDGATIALATALLVPGLLVALRQPRNPVGWVLAASGLATIFSVASSLYTLLDFGPSHGSLPFGLLLLFAQNAFWVLPMLIGMTGLLLFPDGRLSRSGRWALRAYVVIAALVVVSQAIPAAYFVSLPHLHLDAAGQYVPVPSPGPVVGFLATGLPLLAVVPFWLAWIVRLAIRLRRSAGDARQQFKWFTAGAAVAVAGLVTLTIIGASGNSAALAGAANVAATYAVIALPLGMGLGILRYRLYDIDRIISRTVGYALVTGLLIGVYAGLVLLATEVLGFASTWAVAGSTLAAAALFTPLRRRVQRAVDRRFNRARYDADAAVAAFAARLSGAVALDEVRADLLGSVKAALEPAHVSVWVESGSRVTPGSAPRWA
jgi:hypothetical protein